MNKKTRSGYVAIVGQPNVGKSTLLNHLLGKKITITSRKPQTTRHRILGVKTIEDVQIMYVDTPGLHIKEVRAMNRYMNREAKAALRDVNVIVFVVDALRWNDQDDWVLSLLKDVSAPVILAVNKVDTVSDRKALLPYIDSLSKKFHFSSVIPISAKKGDQLDALEKEIIIFLPQDVHYYPPDQITNRSEHFMAAEFVREKLMRSLGQEIPYALTVTIESYEELEKIINISAIIWVEKPGQKAIVIGKDGARLKAVGSQSRKDMERHFEKQVFLRLWVKVKSGWSDDERLLRSLGYD